MVPHSEAGVKDKGDDEDREMIQKLTDELVNVKNARDGIPHDLFPLNSEDLSYYKFSLKGETNRAPGTFCLGQPASRTSAFTLDQR
jgi:hypothetical protein